MEWPPKSGVKKTFPGIDKAEWFQSDAAKKIIIKGQSIFIDQLINILNGAEEGNLT
jgi:predicted NUDIX family NTP pyrophosphohydrolase